MKKVLITGVKGFIGSKLYEKFTEEGFCVDGWDIFLDEKAGCKKVDMIEMDNVLKELEVCNPDIIIHCAGSADVAKSVQNPDGDYKGNVTITHNLLFAMHQLKMKGTRFVFLSSAGVYGNPSALPITEDMVRCPMSPYALHKVMCEDLCEYFVKNYQMDIKVARVFSAYGAGLRKQIFWDMYNKYKSNGRLDMFGTGAESRDYIHVDDVVNAVYILATKDSNQTFFNVANGEEVTIRTATELFAMHAGINGDKISFNGIVREGEPLNWRADISRISALGYQKSVKMSDGLKGYLDWVKQFD